MGPERPVSVDVRGWLYSYIQGKSIDRNIIAFNKETIFEQPDTSEDEKTEEEGPSQTPQEQVQIAMAVKQEQPVVEEQVMAKNPVVVPSIVSETELPKEPEADSEELEKEIAEEPVEEQRQEIVVAKIPEDNKQNSNNQIEETVKNKPSDEIKAENKQLVIEDKSSDSTTDFWNSFLIKGDQIAATIGNSSNYSPSK